MTVIFLQISRKPQLQPRTWQFLQNASINRRSPINRRFQRYIVHTEILSTFYARVKNAIQTNWDEKLPKPPFPFRAHGPHLIHPSLDRPHSPPQTTSRSNQPCCHNTLYWQTNRQTNRWVRQQLCTNSAYAHTLWMVCHVLIIVLLIILFLIYKTTGIDILEMIMADPCLSSLKLYDPCLEKYDVIHWLS